MEDRLNTLRQALRLSWGDLATRLRLSRSMLDMLRKGQRNAGFRTIEIIEQVEREAGIRTISPAEKTPQKKPTIYKTDCSASAAGRDKWAGCRYPDDCDLPARLAAMEGQMTEIRMQLQTILGLLGVEVQDRVAKMKKGAA